jgi:hypothetical protein
MSEIGEVRNGFILIFKDEEIGDRWVALHHIVAVIEYAGATDRCGVFTAHSEGWIGRLPAVAVRRAVAEWREAEQDGGAR